MGDISENFNRREFACKCGCGFDTIDIKLIEALEEGRESFERFKEEPVYIQITGPNRCAQHNSEVGGAPESEHLYARAVDHKYFIQSSGELIDPVEVYSYYNDRYPNSYGLGLYSNRVHLDTRSGNAARWDAT